MISTAMRAAWKWSLGAMLAIAFSLLLSPPLFAHVQNNGLTRVVFNERSGNIEFMHRYLVHDAEHAASQLFGTGQDLLDSPVSRELFANYVINRFAVEAGYTGDRHGALPLDFVGVEVDGQYIWIYQESPIEPDIERFTIVNLVLRDVWPEQSNLLNIERAGQVYTLTFEGSVEEQDVELLPE